MQQQTGARATPLRVGRQRVLNRLDEEDGDVGSHVAEPGPLAQHVRRTKIFDRAPLDRILAGNQMVEQNPDTVDIAGSRRRLSGQHFRRHVQRRAGDVHSTRLGFLGGLKAGAEVHQDDSAFRIAHDVPRGHIAMHEPGAVHSRQRPAHVLADQRRFARIQLVPAVHRLLERLATHELHAQPDAAFVRLHAEDADDVGVTHFRERAPLTEQALGQLGVRDMPMQDLDGDFALELRIPCPIHAAERSRTDAPQ